MTVLVGVDVGGTFTDVVVWESDSGGVWLEKVPTTPGDPRRGTLSGIRGALRQAGVAPKAVTSVRHGTTVGTNALIQRSGAPTGLITTKGFRDVLEIGRTKRDATYDLLWSRLPPLARRRHRREVTERISAAGEILTPLDVEELEREFRFLISEGIESVAVSFINSYTNPQHEELAVERLRSINRRVSITRGSEIMPSQGEYERTSLATLNAYISPLISSYLDDLQRELARDGTNPQISVMQSNGGVMDIPYARVAPVRLILSGPCAGVTGAAAVAGNLGIKNLVTFDMGGTSCDVCLVEGGLPHLTTNGSVAGYNLNLLPMLYINTVGAGGGSIARVDAGGALKVGPSSAGAVPGPACYGTGGELPTVTDAWATAGYLDPNRFLGGRLSIHPKLAERSLGAIADRLGFAVDRTSEGVLSVVTANMVSAVKAVSVKRGRDPKDLVLVAYGGAGPLAAAEVARQLGIRRVLVPKHPGMVCALGTLIADVQYDVKRSFHVPLNGHVLSELHASLSQLTDNLAPHLLNGPQDSLTLRREAYLRYAGQFHSVPMQLPDALTEAALGKLRLDFDAAFQREYGHARRDQPVEFDALRVVARYRTGSAPSFASSSTSVKSPSAQNREVLIGGRKGICRVLQWPSLGVGWEVAGPAIVEDFDSTVWIPPEGRGQIVDDGSILMEV